MTRRGSVLAWGGAAAVVALLAVLVLAAGGSGPFTNRTPSAPPSLVSSAAPVQSALAVPSRAPISSAAQAPSAAVPSASPVPVIDPASGLPAIRRAALPPEALTALALIAAGGPFPYAADGATFRNLEGILPKHASGYYHEYTVVTPGSADRGARRIVTGGAGEQYWTDDHYASFRRIVP